MSDGRTLLYYSRMCLANESRLVRAMQTPRWTVLHGVAWQSTNNSSSIPVQMWKLQCCPVEAVVQPPAGRLPPAYLLRSLLFAISGYVLASRDTQTLLSSA